jgi:hypothetical protein
MTSLSGRFEPDLSDHHLDRHISAIRDFTSHTVSDPNIAGELTREASEGVEMAGDQRQDGVERHDPNFD